jgi:hypothetical protein
MSLSHSSYHVGLQHLMGLLRGGGASVSLGACKNGASRVHGKA